MSAGPGSLPPGSTIGILGGGQLGRMTALAAARLGYRCHVFSPTPGEPGTQVAAESTIAPGSLAGVVAQLPAQVVRGRHGWLLTEPAAFAELVRNALVVHAMLERRAAVLPGPGRQPATALVRRPRA